MVRLTVFPDVLEAMNTRLTMVAKSTITSGGVQSMRPGRRTFKMQTTENPARRTTIIPMKLTSVPDISHERIHTRDPHAERAIIALLGVDRLLGLSPPIDLRSRAKGKGKEIPRKSVCSCRFARHSRADANCVIAAYLDLLSLKSSDSGLKALEERFSAFQRNPIRGYKLPKTFMKDQDVTSWLEAMKNRRSAFLAVDSFLADQSETSDDIEKYKRHVLDGCSAFAINMAIKLRKSTGTVVLEYYCGAPCDNRGSMSMVHSLIGQLLEAKQIPAPSIPQVPTDFADLLDVLGECIQAQLQIGPLVCILDSLQVCSSKQCTDLIKYLAAHTEKRGSKRAMALMITAIGFGGMLEGIEPSHKAEILKSFVAEDVDMAPRQK